MAELEARLKAVADRLALQDFLTGYCTVMNDLDASAVAARFADEWDQVAFDPAYDTPPLESFEERLRALFSRPRML